MPLPSLWWPGDHRAGDAMSDEAFLHALLQTEQAWLDALVAAGCAPPDATADLTRLVGTADLEVLALDAEAGGNPVIPLVRLLRERAPGRAATWLHRGLTSQDVVDTALVLCARDAVTRVRDETAAQVARLVELVVDHRDTAMVARTLTQHAVPTTFAAKAAGWLHAVLDAADDLTALRYPLQLGGAAGTLSGLVELAGVEGARAVRRDLPRRLALEPGPPWHTARAPLTRLGDAAVRATDAWGKLAHDVLQLGRPEIGELVEPSRGGSSTMPHKANPTLAVLVRRAALTTPPLAATLHLAAADQVDERAAGAWHAEWDTLATLLRRTVVAARHTTALLDGLEVRADRMAANLRGAGEQPRAEQRTMAGLTGRDPEATYDGLGADLVDEVLERAQFQQSRSGAVPPTKGDRP